jgi:hypothetical protein
MKLTLDLDGMTASIVMEGETKASERPQVIQGMAKLLNSWAEERDKCPENAPEGDDKDNGC